MPSAQWLRAAITLARFWSGPVSGNFGEYLAQVSIKHGGFRVA